VRLAENTTQECVCLHHGAMSVMSQGTWQEIAQNVTRATPEGNLLLINLDQQLLWDEGDHLRPDPITRPGMLGSLRQEDEYSARKPRKKVKNPHAVVSGMFPVKPYQLKSYSMPVQLIPLLILQLRSV